MKNYDKGTVIRTVLLIIALINQTMLMFGKSPLGITEDQVNQLADALYTAVSVIFTIGTTLAAWFKNNYVTTKGHKQKAILKQNNLTK
ncbi:MULTISPECIES: phage holin [unclassified Bacillus (in: firmicutes)]|uniref:phage holin n=1 Tax=unclassified Bacillus (in: firmicutes) TaxID=185979 RepID=UPI002281384C|nr:phage holin [Bacillus sp. S20C3]MCY8290272.1 phage holin [Bacillus sp. N13C7]MCY8638752.1 phage holin [Bacillus sp. S17B2]MCY9144780.1 phage holin [Bacillus sp. T9C1]